MSDLVKFTKPQAEFHHDLVRNRNKDISLLLPEDLTASEILRYSHIVAGMVDSAGKSLSMYLVALGRLHYLARMNQEVLAKAECRDITAYESKVLDPSGRHHASIWKFSAAYKEYEDALTPALAAEIGGTKLEKITQAVKGKKLTRQQKQKFLDKAASKTTKQLQSWIEKESGFSEPGDTSAALFEVFCSRAECNRLKAHLANEGLRQLFDLSEGARPIDMILASFENNENEIEHHDPKQLTESPYQVESGPAQTNGAKGAL